MLRTGVIWKSGWCCWVTNRSGWLLELLTEPKNLQHNFPKMKGGGVKGRFDFFQKFTRFGSAILLLFISALKEYFIKPWILNIKLVSMFIWSKVLYPSIRDSSTKKAIKIASVVAGVIFPAPRKILFSEPCDALEKSWLMGNHHHSLALKQSVNCVHIPENWKWFSWNWIQI